MIAVKKTGHRIPIHDVESVRMLQEFGILPIKRDAQEIYDEITRGASTSEATCRCGSDEFVPAGADYFYPRTRICARCGAQFVFTVEIEGESRAESDVEG